MFRPLLFRLIGPILSPWLIGRILNKQKKCVRLCVMKRMGLKQLFISFKPFSFFKFFFPFDLAL